MPQEIDHIAELQKKLYSRDPNSLPKRKFGILRPEKNTVENAWGATEIPPEKRDRSRGTSGYKRFFIFSFIFFAIGLGVAAFSVYRGALTLSSKNVDVNILGNSFAAGGEELPLEIEVANKNSADMIDATLTIEYPRGAIDEAGGETVRIERPLGTIASSKTKSEAVTVVLYGEQGTTRTISARLSYYLAGASVAFQKDQTFEVTISSSPISLTVDGPSNVASNQPFTITLRNLFTGDTLPSRTIVRAEYPGGFVFQSANPRPIAGNNVWALGDLVSGQERTIAITGKTVGEEGDLKSFRIYVGTPEGDTDTKIGTVYNSSLHSLTLTKPFVGGTIIVGSGDTDISAVPIGERVQGGISWVNSSTTPIVNPVFTLSITGGAVDQSSVDAGDGTYNPVTRAITWNGETIPALATLAPGAAGQLPFSFASASGDSSDIVLSLSVRGTNPSAGYTEQTISNLDARTVRFAARLQLAAASLYSAGPITNSGPFPPKADTATTYTITWSIRPIDRALANLVATATLPQGVRWNGVIVPQSEVVQYNPETRVITWNAGNLQKAGSVSGMRTVSFQVGITPAKSQIGTEIDLLDTTTLTATDTVANVQVSTTRPSLSTRLDSDPLYSPGKEKVVP